MDSIVNAMLNLGWGTIPVGVASAVTEKNQIGFTTLHNCGTAVEIKKGSGKNASPPPPKTASVVSAIKKTSFCPACEVEVEDTVKGYEVSPGKFAIVTEEELDAIKPPDTKEIVVSKFVPSNAVTAVMAEKHYFLLPNPHAQSAYGLLYQALAETKTAAVGSMWLWQRKEHPCAIVADQSHEGGVLVMQILRETEDMVVPDFAAPIPDVTKAEKKLLKDLITAQKTDLEPSDLVSAQRTRLSALVEAKLAGTDVPTISTPAAVPDLMDSLRAAVAALEKV